MEKSAITRVTKVEWVTQGTGKLYPVVHYEPVDIGCYATKASGKSHRYIFENGVGVGADIRVTRPGNTAPNIDAVITPRVPAPVRCQYGCDPEYMEIDGAHTYCQNPKCPAITKTIFERLIKTFAPEGFSVAMREAVMASFNYDVVKMLKFYKSENYLRCAGVKGLTKHGEKLVNKMVENLVEWKISLYQLAYIAVIEFFGESQAHEIEKLFVTNKEMKHWVINSPTLPPWLCMKDKAAINWAKRHNAVKMLLRYFYMIRITAREKRSCPGFVCINGRLEKGSKRTFAKEHIEPYGYKWVKTMVMANILIDADGTKSWKTSVAKKRRIKIIPIKKWLEERAVQNLTDGGVV